MVAEYVRDLQTSHNRRLCAVTAKPCENSQAETTGAPAKLDPSERVAQEVTRPPALCRCASSPRSPSPSSSTSDRSKTLSWSTPNIERQHEQLAVPNRIVLLRSRDDHQHGATMTFSLDFATRPEGRNDPRARDISERINAHIDAALFRARSEEEKREYVDASASSNESLRAVQFNYAGVEPDEGCVTGRLLRIFDTGHHFEDIVAGWLRLAASSSTPIDPATGNPIAATSPSASLHFWGAGTSSSMR